jgi:hypothetical protein
MLKPRRERRILAVTLSGELANNVLIIRANLGGTVGPPRGLLSKSLADTVYSASVSRLGELSFADTLRVTRVYAVIREYRERESVQLASAPADGAANVAQHHTAVSLVKLSETAIATLIADMCVGVAITLLTQYPAGWRAFIPTRWRHRGREVRELIAHVGKPVGTDPKAVVDAADRLLEQIRATQAPGQVGRSDRPGIESAASPAGQ